MSYAIETLMAHQRDLSALPVRPPPERASWSHYVWIFVSNFAYDQLLTLDKVLHSVGTNN